MFGFRVNANKKLKDEAEKPFWISFADLMTALMVMFLLVMSVALLAVTKTVSEEQRLADARREAIEKLLNQIEAAVQHDDQFKGIHVNRDRQTIAFGDRARFESGSSQLSGDQAQYLRAFVPEILSIAGDELGRKWLKRIVVEGFADQRGDYLLNLNLSLQRSQRVLCVLLAPPGTHERALKPSELEQIRDLFFVGGYSYNSAKKTFEESRRIELRLEFFGIDEPRPRMEVIPRGNFGVCRI